MKIYYDPLDKACKSITGAIPRSAPITFQVYQESGEGNFSANSCTFLLFEDGGSASEYPMTRTENGWAITLKINQSGLYFYHFNVDGKILSCGSMRKGVFSGSPLSYQLTVYEKEFQTPEWMKGGIMYQIFPDRFCKVGDYPIAGNKVLRRDWGGMPRFRPNEFGKVLNNDFFGGNFNGIRSKLDFLAELGVSVIYLNPIFEAFSNHRYDTGDYRKIDQLLGTEEDFDNLISEANEKGIRIILDGVFNHTGDDSRYFNKYGRYQEELGAHQSPSSPYFGWYHFQNFPTQYDSWWGIDTLPAVNEASPSYQQFIFGEDGVLRHWLKHGIAGYRLDVADELPDFFIEKIRSAVKAEDDEAIVIGEVWEDASNKIAYSKRRRYFQGKELDSVMNYPLKDAIIASVLYSNPRQLRETVAMLVDHYPKQVLDSLMNILSTHDTVRILTVLGGKTCSSKEEMASTRLSDEEKTIAKSRLKIAALLQYTLPGVPCIYYGDENGMEGYADPFCRYCYDWERTDEDLLNFYRKLGALRKGELNESLATGEYHEVFADEKCYIFKRTSKHQTAYVYVNFGYGIYHVKHHRVLSDLLNGQKFEGKFEIKPKSYGILLAK